MKRHQLFPSRFLKADDLNGASVVVKIAKLKLETLETNGKSETKAVLYFANLEKAMVLNVTNYNSIADLHGDETDEWPGCAIELFPTTTEMKGKIVDCIRIRAPYAADIKDKGATSQATPRPQPTPKQDKPLYKDEWRDDMDDSIPF
jgi:hypothetical protein